LEFLFSILLFFKKGKWKPINKWTTEKKADHITGVSDQWRVMWLNQVQRFYRALVLGMCEYIELHTNK
jgi:hypothetical protein